MNDKKVADKNIIMQMRKAMDVKGNMKIEFGDGKKEKVDPKILQMMVTAHGKIQKPRDKEKFVAMISKSKRDMLNVAKMVGKQLKMGEEIELDERDKKNKYVSSMDRKFSDTAMSNIQINKEVQALYDRIMGKTGIKYKREFMRGVTGRKNKQTHVIVVNKKDKTR